MDVKQEVDSLGTKKELTDKFLSGEITFTEYTERWSSENDEYGDGEGDVDNNEGNEPAVEASASSSQSKDEDGGLNVEKKVIQRRVRKQLPLALSGLMGEANLRYVRGERDMAEKICYEIIRQSPLSPEPYLTLAQLYEHEPDKSLSFSLIAAHLNPSDAELWIRLATISEEKGDLRQALVCYSKAINANPKQLDYHRKRLDLVKFIENNKTPDERKLLIPWKLSSQLCLTRMMSWYPESEGKTVINIAKKVAKEYVALGNNTQAAFVMDKAYFRFPTLFTYEDLNLYFELFLLLSNYEKCLNLFVIHCKITVETEYLVQSEGQTTLNIVNCYMPENLPVDLRAKFIICLIHLKAFHLIDSFLNDIIKTENVEITGDIYLDIEEALTSEKCHIKALKLLEILVKSKRYSLPAVWLKYAECLSALNKNSDAINAYNNVVNLAPQHLDARFKLSLLLVEENRIDEALVALEQNENTDVLDVGLLYERCKILQKKGDLNQFLRIGQMFLSRHFFMIRRRDELLAFKTKDTGEALKIIREARGEAVEDIYPYSFDEGNNQITTAMEYQLLKELLKTAYNLKKFNFLQKLAFSALGSKKFCEFKSELEFASLLSCMYNEDYSFAFTMIRDYFKNWSTNTGMLNTFNLIIQKSIALHHNKFLMRAIAKQPTENIPLRVLYANCCLLAGSYKNALKDYINWYKKDECPLNMLLCAITMVHMACQRFSSNKHTLVMQCCAFMKQYEEVRGSYALQEVYYNTGRLYHQLGLVHLACQFYKRALEVKVDYGSEYNNILDLKREIAFNLHLIYKKDAPDLARMYLEKYIVI